MAVNPQALKNLRPWKKGETGNVFRQYSRIPEELRGIKSLTNGEVIKIISKYARSRVSQLQELIKDPKADALDKAICSIFMSSIEKADFQKLSFLLDRCVGKVKEYVPEDDEEIDEVESLKQLSMTELLTLVKNNLPESA